MHGLVLLKPDEKMDAITFREAIDRIGLMFPDALYQIGGYADVQRSPRTAGKQIHARDLLHTWNNVRGGSWRTPG